MKKILFVATLISMAINANAQKLSSAMHEGQSLKTTFDKFEAHKDFVKHQKKSAAKALRKESVADLKGPFVLTYYDWNGEIQEASEFTIEPATGTINLDLYDEPEDFEYNVKLNGFTWSDGVAYGYFDEEDNSLFIPLQKIGSSANKDSNGNTYGTVALSGCVRSDDGESVNIGYNIVMYLEDGKFELDSQLAGWYSFLPDYSGSGGWNFGFDIRILPVTGQMSWYTTVARYVDEVLGQTQSGSNYGIGSCNVSVEDYGVAVNVYNFIRQASVEIMINDDGTCQMAMLQPFDSYDYSDDDFAYGYIHLIAPDAEGYADESVEYLYGHIENDVLVFYTTTEDGKQFDDTGLFLLATSFDKEGQAYGIGWFYGMEIDLPTSGSSDDKTTGIVNANESRIQKVKNTKAYNLMGQEVDYRNSKGVIVLNGKKYIAK